MSSDAGSRNSNQRRLIAALEACQKEFATGISEYALIRLLQSERFLLLDEDALRDSLTLFQCHFMLFNGLYQLRDKWVKADKGWLSIHATAIVLQPLTHSEAGLAEADPLQAYYLDWANLDQTNKQDVDDLISDFWLRMGNTLTPAEEQKARQILEFNPDEALSKSLVKKRYYKLQHHHHPDKGGDGEAASDLTWAYNVLVGAV